MIITKGNKKLLNAEIAKGLSGRVFGLMGRKKIGEGMIFDFLFDGHWAMWAFGMKVSMDVIFIEGNGRVVQIFRNVRPISTNYRTWKVIRPSKRCRYVLELGAGMADKKRINVGNMLTIKR